MRFFNSFKSSILVCAVVFALLGILVVKGRADYTGYYDLFLNAVGVPTVASTANPFPVTNTQLQAVITETVSASTITTGGTPQTALAASTTRNGCQITNTSSGIEYIDINSIPVTPINQNQSYTCNPTGTQVSQQTIYIKSATTGAGFVVASW